MDDNGRVALKEYIEKIIDLRFSANQYATKLAAEELSRRLDILNHAHEAAIEIQRTYLPRETFEARIHTIERTLWALGGVIAFLTFGIPILIQLLK